MENETAFFADLERRMQGAAGSLKADFGGLRTGRASASLLEPVKVEAYGQTLPLSQVATVSAPESRLIAVQVWDKTLAAAVEKGIRAADLGLNPSADGTLIRVPVPALSEERRRELSKLASKYAEQARIAVRNVRRSGVEAARRSEKEMGKDETRAVIGRIQDMTTRFVGEIDKAAAEKEKEIMHLSA